MLFFAVKVVASGLIIAYCAWLAGARPVLAGYLTALPLMSILGLTWAFIEHRDMDKINLYATSILVAVPLSLTFFIPFVLNRWLRLGFWPSLALGIVLLVIAFKVHQTVFHGG